MNHCRKYILIGLALLVIVNLKLGIHCIPVVKSQELQVLWAYNTGGDLGANSPVPADVDGDGKLEVIIKNGNGIVYCINSEDGSVLWTFNPGSAPGGQTPALYDINNDGIPEIFIGAGNTMYALYGNEARYGPSQQEKKLAEQPWEILTTMEYPKYCFQVLMTMYTA